jgi:hypothetical protein
MCQVDVGKSLLHSKNGKISSKQMKKKRKKRREKENCEMGH